MKNTLFLVGIAMFLLLSPSAYSTEDPTFYYTFGTNKNFITLMEGRYSVEFPEGLTNPEGFEGVELTGNNFYMVTDTTNLDEFAEQHIVRSCYYEEGLNFVYETGQIVLHFKDNADPEEINNLIETFELVEVETNAVFGTYKCPNAVAAAIEIYETNLVDFCHPNFIITVEKHYTPTDPYFGKQFYLHNTGQTINDGQSGTADADIDAPEAWDITKGDSTVWVAVIDDGIQKKMYDIPLSRQIRLPGSDVYHNNGNDPEPIWADESHGTACAGIIAATQDNTGTAGIAPKCKIVPVKMFGAAGGGTMTNASIAHSVGFGDSSGAKILACSWGWGNTNDPNYNVPVVEAAIRNALKRGKFLSFSCGNEAGDDSLTDIGLVQFPANLNLPGMVAVGASTKNDTRALYSPISSRVEIVAPSAPGFSCSLPAWSKWPDVWTSDMLYANGYNPWPFDTTTYIFWNPIKGKNDTILNNKCMVAPGGYAERLPFWNSTNTSDSFICAVTGRFSGTSAAAPQVSGVAALMLSINPCVSNTMIKDILLNTADKVGGYNYNWSVTRPGHSKEFGYGRLNAYKAVYAAQQSSAVLDLYMKDLPDDFGYKWTPNANESPDVWVRNQNDGIEIHQDPEWTNNSPVYVYVRVRNKSCNSNSGSPGRIKLYWSKAASWSSWPQNWHGGTIGDSIGSKHLGTIGAGKDSVYIFSWQPQAALINWGVCILARIEGITADPITVYSNPKRLDWDICRNNNITIRNTKVVNVAAGIAAPIIDDIQYPHGAFIYLGNATDGAQNINVTLAIPSYASTDITSEAEVTLTFQDEDWAFLVGANAFDVEGVEVIGDRTVQLTQPSVTLNTVEFAEDQRIPVYVGFAFLVDTITMNTDYEYKVTQALAASPDTVLGTENFIIHKEYREPFPVDAGDDLMAEPNSSVTLNALVINEPAVYRWYDQKDSLVHTGSSYTVTPDTLQKYTLEVISTVDGFKGYDEVKVDIKKFFITSLVPNPANGQFVINYNADDATSASITILNNYGQTINTHTLSVTQTQATISITNYQPGMYQIVLYCNGQVVDSKALSVN